jgi:hypothetical protein
MKPSHSIKGLRKGSFEKPRSFRDRIYLTDVGEALWQAALGISPDARLSLLSHRNYMLTRATITAGSLSVHVEGYTVGRSSFTSAFRVSIVGEQGSIGTFLGRVVGSLDRTPFTSPYWGDPEWGALEKEHLVTRESIRDGWRKALPDRVKRNG